MRTLLVVVAAIIVVGIFAATQDKEPAASSARSATTYSARSTTTAKPIDAARQLRLVEGSLEVTHTGVGYLSLTGKIKNGGLSALRFVKVRGYALTESGATVNTDYSYIDSDVLAPGQTATYTIYVDDPDDEATRGRVVIEGASFDD